MGVELPTRVPIDEFDLSDLEFWRQPRDYRHGAFRTLRDTDGLPFYEERSFEGSPLPPGPGYYAITRHDDVWSVSRNPALFCSGKGSNIGDMPPELNDFFGSMINMDDPRHFRLRSLVSKGFTPSSIGSVMDSVHRRAGAIIDRVLEKHPDGECDFVEEIAAPLPLEIICDMMGVPQHDVEQVFRWTNEILGLGDPEYPTDFDGLMKTALEIFAYAQALGEDRLANERDDITSMLMHADVDGERLTSQEFGSFFILLVVAGNETTRNAVSHGMLALTQHPGQRQLWFDDFDTHAKTAVDEIVRWSSPVIHFRRTATEDTEVGGQPIKAGDKVVMFYQSANRDERAYDDPFRFDVARPINPQQVGFGAGGPHFCLGANLARREMTVMFDEIRRRLPNLRIVDEPDYLLSMFIHGIKRMRCSWV